MTADILLIAFTGLMILLGLVGVILPFLPGAPLAWIGILVYGLATDFQEISVTAVVVMGIFTLLTLVVDVLMPVFGLQKQKASKSAILGSLIGTFAGAAVLGPIGLLVGPFIGAFVGELIAGQNSHPALRSAVGAAIGFFVGSVIKVAIVLAMAGYFIYALIF